ncbi:unnamed protein product [Psylliodes chrysocephalus]|uniref:CCHC-type domain-containing protein n=1 Tax=Psylliodes chrysocephalus TaxID=3402493 RepID=A0A9P0CJH1_9CUCU|nr:unnamed protein product [Psylliodes chrysocephala]
MATIEEELHALKRVRSTIKGQLTHIKNYLDGLASISCTEAKIRLTALDNILKKFTTNQDKIELRSSDSELLDEITMRNEMEEKFIKLQIYLNEIIEMRNEVTEVGTNTKNLEIAGSSRHYPEIKVNFTPYQDNERFENFIKRLEVYIKIQGADSNEEVKKLTLLNYVTPEIHQTLYDLCSPEEPIQKNYEDLIKILSDFLDPKPSIWARQHKFINRMQQKEVPIAEFNKELKKLSKDCNFFCECGKSNAENFLQLQFIRGLYDDQIRMRILQEKNKLSYKETVELAINTAMAKQEAVVDKDGVLQIREQSNFKQIEKNTYRNRNKTTFKPKSDQCYRCGDTRHRAFNCLRKNLVCSYCKIKGHIAKVCLKRLNGQDRQNILNTTDFINDNTIIGFRN